MMLRSPAVVRTARQREALHVSESNMANVAKCSESNLSGRYLWVRVWVYCLVVSVPDST